MVLVDSLNRRSFHVSGTRNRVELTTISEPFDGIPPLSSYPFQIILQKDGGEPPAIVRLHLPTELSPRKGQHVPSVRSIWIHRRI